MKERMKCIILAMVLVLSVSLFTACKGSDSKTVDGDAVTPVTAEPSGSNSTDSEEQLPPLQLSIMLPYGTNEYDNEEITQRFYGAIEEYTNTELEFIFYDLDMYYEKLALIFASGDIPTVVVTGKSAEFLNAVENDAFWDISDYIYEYPNLSVLSEVVFQNAGINGRLFGVPRSRDLGRNGFGYRLDWLNNLGLKEPETIEELYNMLTAFTYDDPDGNGKNDTYGLGVTSYAGVWDIMQTWFGVPNGWGIDDNGDLVPAILTEEYTNALKWFRKIYSEGLVNPDFDEITAGDWDTVLLRSGVAGASADVVDRFRRNQGYFDDEGIPAETMIIGAVDAGYGLRALPTAGYADMLAISKQKVKTEEELKRVLQFINDMSDGPMLDLVELGFLNESYKIDENGFAVLLTEEEKTELGVPIYDFRKGMNQLLSYFINPGQEIKRTPRETLTSDILRLEAEVKAENEKIAVINYGASYTSKTYTGLAEALDTIMADARIAYIKGSIDDVGLQEAKDQWLRSGGEKVIKEMNELYHANKE